jgi:macrodomain Ter protein organizer (MatP/YcbG family)
MADDRTSIQLELDTWQRLNKQKRKPNETFNDVVVRLLDHWESCDDRDEE